MHGASSLIDVVKALRANEFAFAKLKRLQSLMPLMQNQDFNSIHWGWEFSLEADLLRNPHHFPTKQKRIHHKSPMIPQ